MKTSTVRAVPFSPPRSPAAANTESYARSAPAEQELEIEVDLSESESNSESHDPHSAPEAPSAPTPADALSGMDVACTHCKIPMRGYLGSGNTVRYFRCDRCRRWISSTYAEVLRADVKMRATPAGKKNPDAKFAEVKGRLDRWLAALDDRDPYRVMGLSPFDSVETVRNRYRALAFQFHPDRGGTEEQMRELNLAYERITRHLENKRREALTAGLTRKELSEETDSGSAHSL